MHEPIKPDFLDQYERELTFIWDQVVRLNTNVYLLEKIVDFPFGEEVVIEPTFWEYALEALFDSSVLISWKLVSDKKGFSLLQFKNSVSERYIEEEEKMEFKELIKKIEFNRKLESEKGKVEVLRQKQIAHLDLKAREQVEAIKLDITELRELVNLITELFTVLSFSAKAVLPLAYHPKALLPGQTPESTDIDKILEFMKSL